MPILDAPGKRSRAYKSANYNHQGQPSLASISCRINHLLLDQSLKKLTGTLMSELPPSAVTRGAPMAVDCWPPPAMLRFQLMAVRTGAAAPAPAAALDAAAASAAAAAGVAASAPSAGSATPALPPAAALDLVMQDMGMFACGHWVENKTSFAVHGSMRLQLSISILKP